MRRLLTLALLLGTFPNVYSQDRTPPEHPKVVLLLPSNTASENAQITYFMTGPFGGYGNWVKAESKHTAFEIEASVDDKPAADVKVIAWLPGCEITTHDISIEHEKEEIQLSCKPLHLVNFEGQLFPNSILADRRTEIEVTYLADWAFRFFDIADGAVPLFRLGKTSPDPDGNFQIKLPDLTTQVRITDGEFQFILREKGTGNIVARLKPMDTATTPGNLKILPEYPAVIRFATEPQ